MNRNRNRSCLAREIVKPSALCRMGKTDYFRGQARKQTFTLLLVIALTWIRLGIDNFYNNIFCYEAMSKTRLSSCGLMHEIQLILI